MMVNVYVMFWMGFLVWFKNSQKGNLYHHMVNGKSSKSFNIVSLYMLEFLSVPYTDLDKHGTWQFTFLNTLANQGWLNSVIANVTDWWLGINIGITSANFSSQTFFQNYSSASSYESCMKNF